MKKKFTTRQWSRRLLLMMGCLATLVAVQAANITVDGINYTTKTDGTCTVAKYTIIKASGDTPADTAFYKGDIVIPSKITYEGAEYTVENSLDKAEKTTVTANPIEAIIDW